MAYLRDKALREIRTAPQFEAFHAQWVDEVRHRISTSKGGRCSHGQAQKAINVFLKVYVDFAGRPDQATARRLRRFLHVPLDSLVMKAIRSRYREDAARPPKPKNYSLSNLHDDDYLKWQEFLRRKHPTNPVLFDVAWWQARKAKARNGR
jgi:hypothetical protein